MPSTMMASPCSMIDVALATSLDGRDAERASHDGDMARRPAFLQHEAAQARAVVVEEGRRPHGACHQDGIVGQRSFGRHHVAADELVQQAVGEIVEIVQAVPQIRVGLAQHPGAVVGLHALDRGFRGEAGADSLAHAPEPALVVGEHPESLQDLPVLAMMGDVAALDQLVDGGTDLADRLLEALEFGFKILGDQVFEHDPGFVQHHVTKANAFRQDRPGVLERTAERGSGPDRRQRLQFA